MSPSKVLIPVDGSPASLRALDFAIEMARQHPGASLLPLNVQTISATEATSAAMGSDWQDTASRASAGATESAPHCRNLLAAQSTKKFVEVSQVAASFAPKTQLLSPAQCCL